MYNNKIAFLNQKPKSLFIFVILSIEILIGLIIISLKVYHYQHYLTKGYVDCSNTCVIISYVPTNIEPVKIKLNNKDWNATVLKKDVEINEEEMRSYYKITYQGNNSLKHQEIVDLNYCYQKQSVFQTLKNKIFR